MSTRTNNTRHDLEQLRLPDLQVRFREVTGEASRSPNRTFLMRRIEEALAARAEAEAKRAATEAASTNSGAAGDRAPASSSDVRDAGSVGRPPRGRFTSMTVEELQAKYLDVVGRATGSDDRRYLVWKLREAEKGRVPVGPRKTRERDGEPLEVKILPLRLEADVVERMDEAWRSRGIKNRMEFFRRALGHYLVCLGADDVATLLAIDRS